MFCLIFLFKFLLHHYYLLVNHRFNKRHHFFIPNNLTYIADDDSLLREQSLNNKMLIIRENHAVKDELIREHYLRLARQAHTRRQGCRHHLTMKTKIIITNPIPELKLQGINNRIIVNNTKNIFNMFTIRHLLRYLLNKTRQQLTSPELHNDTLPHHHRLIQLERHTVSESARHRQRKDHVNKQCLTLSHFLDFLNFFLTKIIFFNISSLLLNHYF